MTIRLDTPLAEGVAPGFGNRTEAGARQERWMQELERAAFGARKASAPARPQAPAASAAPMADDAARGPATPDRAPVRTGHPVALQCLDAATPQAPVLPVLAGALALAGAFDPGAAPAARSPAAIASGPAATSAPDTPAATLAMARLRLDAAAQPAAPAPGPRLAAPVAEPYAAAHLQLFANASDATVQAFLRDAALDSAGARAVGASMAAALATQGKRLAGLTVNGRVVALPEKPEQTSGTASPLPSTTWYRTGDLA
jgi:hypothetical protein